MADLTESKIINTAILTGFLAWMTFMAVEMRGQRVEISKIVDQQVNVREALAKWTGTMQALSSAPERMAKLETRTDRLDSSYIDLAERVRMIENGNIKRSSKADER